jgi:hypothetical protein
MTKETTELIKIIADEGKVFQHKFSGEIYGSEIYLGSIDSPDNYIEVDAPEPEKNDN